MQRYYHVAPESYQEGEDLYSYDSLVEQGQAPPWKWGRYCHAETDVVALFCHPWDAVKFQEDHGGTIYAVELPPEFETEHVRRNKEKFPCVKDRVPGKYVKRADMSRYGR